MKMPLRPLDLPILLLGLLAVVTAFQRLGSGHRAGAWVEIRTAERRLQPLPLDQDRVLHVRGRLGVSTIEIHQGAVRFLDSPCHGKLCIRSGWQRHAGDFAACLPNRVSLLVRGPDRRFDSINF